jgi:hypothetical protein
MQYPKIISAAILADKGETPMDKFLNGYIACALWSSLDDEKPMDEDHSEYDLAPVLLAQMKKDCEQFQKDNEADLVAANEAGMDMGHCGHDFWLTRNHHGSGFWDGDYPIELGERLTKACDKFGSFDLYVGDDKKIYA